MGHPMVVAVAVRLQFIPRREPPDLLGLPWSVPLEDWQHPRLVRMAKGISRHVVRFVSDGDRVYALKETTQADAEREYAMLRLLGEENLPVVEVVGLVTGRTTPPSSCSSGSTSRGSSGETARWPTCCSGATPAP
jgi:hypothetical protein